MTTSSDRQVLYRKWRPSAFADLAGQDHIATTLRNAITQNRVAQAYLFCGTRGSGKTTTARILAKTINCAAPERGDPCDQCQTCVTINQGRSLDIIEIDAASNRGVDAIREIRDKVHFQPAHSRRKVYIIDEAHMLTAEASNAFLKTLEEPPEHVVFILCTTDADRLLPTIISRCQRYDFRKLPHQSIIDRISLICEHERINIDAAAAQTIASRASGSMRDALTMLEQVAIEHQDGITAAIVDESLGIVRSDAFVNLAAQLLRQDTPAALETINQYAWEGGERQHLYRYTLDCLRAAMLIQYDADASIDVTTEQRAQLAAAAQGISFNQLNAAVQTWAEAAQTFRYDAPATLPLELAAAQICQWQPVAAPAPVAHINSSQPEPAPPAQNTPPRPNPQPETDAARPARRPSPQRAATPSQRRQDAMPRRSRIPRPTEPAPPSGADHAQTAFFHVVQDLARHRGNQYNLGALLRNSRLLAIQLHDGILTVPFTDAAQRCYLLDELEHPDQDAALQAAVAKHFADPITVEFVHATETPPPLPETTPHPEPPAHIAPAGPIASADAELVKAAMQLGGKLLEVSHPA